MIRFILGRAGSGKTRHCLEAIRARLRQSPQGPPLIFLVPEQATFQIERALVGTPGLGGFFRAHVLSFRRLAYRLFDEVGGSRVPPAGELKRLLLLKTAIGRRRAGLRFFGRSADKIGFARAVDAALAEWRRYGLTPELVERRLAAWEAEGRGESALALKLRDLALIERAYRESIEGRFADPDDYLARFAAQAAASQKLRGAELWVDGFADFTRREREALVALLRVARSAEIALCLDPEDLGQPDGGAPRDEALRPFALCERTYWRLKREAAGAGLRALPDLHLSPPRHRGRFAKAPALGALEERFLDPRPKPLEKAEAGPEGAARIVCAPTARAEAEFAALEALRLVREEGYRFGEIAFIVRDLERCHDLLRSTLARLGIPFFLDRKREAAHHPLGEFLAAAAQIAAGPWRTPDVVQALKTDLAPVARDEVDRLENHARARGLDGGDWLNPARWIEEAAPPRPGQSPRPLSEIHESATAALRQFCEACGGRVRAGDFASALRSLMAAVGAEDTLERWAQRAEAEGDLETAAEHRQAAEAILGLIGEWAEGLGGAGLSLRDCADLLAEGLGSLRLRLVPPSLDQLLVGAIERSRHPELRTAFVLGMNEKVFPPAPREDPILCDEDRAALAAEGVELGSGAGGRLLNEPYLAYIALTRPSERLILSCAASDERGRPLAPSPFLDRVRSILPFVEVEPIGSTGSEAIDRIGSLEALGAEAARRFADSLARGAGLEAPWAAMADLAREREGPDRAFSRRIAALHYRNRASLEPATARRLYAPIEEISPSRLESLAACPFQCFTRHGLELREREEFRLEPVDRGQLLHRVLAALFNRLRQSGLEWHEAGQSDLEAWLDEALSRQAVELRSALLQSTARNRFLLETFRRALAERVRAIQAESAASDFRQRYAEAAFGSSQAPFPPLQIDLGAKGRLRLRGIIDRIDLGPHPGGGTGVRIWDYKSGASRFIPALARRGIQLQLPAYLLAITRGEAGPARGWRPAGFFYSPLLAGLAKGAAAGDEEPEAEEAPAPSALYKASGLFDSGFAEAMDRTVAEGQASSSWRIYRKKGGAFSDAENRSDAVAQEELGALLDHTQRTLEGLGRKMIGGEVDVAPYRHGKRTPCEYCEFAAVCRFDSSVQPWREIRPEKRSKMFEKIAMGEGNGAVG